MCSIAPRGRCAYQMILHMARRKHALIHIRTLPLWLGQGGFLTYKRSLDKVQEI